LGGIDIMKKVFYLPHPLGPPLQTAISGDGVDIFVWRGGVIFERGWRPSPQATPLFGMGFALFLLH